MNIDFNQFNPDFSFTQIGHNPPTKTMGVIQAIKKYEGE